MVEPNGDILVVGDYDVRRITAATGIIRNVAPYNSEPGFAGAGGPPDVATWSVITGVAAAANGDVIISDEANFRVRRVRSGRVNTVAGIGLGTDGEASKVFRRIRPPRSPETARACST